MNSFDCHRLFTEVNIFLFVLVMMLLSVVVVGILLQAVIRRIRMVRGMLVRVSRHKRRVGVDRRDEAVLTEGNVRREVTVVRRVGVHITSRFTAVKWFPCSRLLRTANFVRIFNIPISFNFYTLQFWFGLLIGEVLRCLSIVIIGRIYSLFRFHW